MGNVLTDIEDVTSVWLTEVLRRNGCLYQGHVTNVRKWGMKLTPVSQVVHLDVDYSNGASGAVPPKLFLKMTKPDLQEELAGIGEGEVKFYNKVASKISPRSLVRCYEAAYDDQEKRFHLLMEDLSATHFSTSWPLPPSEDHCLRVIECLAEVHASWWNNTRTIEEIGPGSFSEYIQRCFQRMRQVLPDFLDFLGDRISTDRRKLYEQILNAAPKLTERILACKGQTLVHNDAHVWNFLFPLDLAQDTVRIIDWQAWFAGLGTIDLAYMIGLHWYPERRARLEKDLLKLYHNYLLKAGVANYDWRDCWYEYRLAVATNVFIPVIQWRYKIDSKIWWGHLERGMLAFEDLDCVELLET